jgi:hypothetical protein
MEELPPISNLSHDPVRAYIEALLAKAGFAHAPAAERIVTVETLTAEAQRRIGLELIEAIDPHSLEAFRRLAAEDATEEELAAFFDVRVPDAEERVQKALEAFGHECLDRAVRLRQELHL